MKVESITIEEFNKVSKQIYEFDNFGYLKGPNGAGKTTVLQAIQLALLGYIPGLNKTAKDVIFNHSKDGKHIGVNLVLNDNGERIVVYRSWDLAKTTIKPTFRLTPTNYSLDDIIGNLELPVFNFTEFAGMTANKLKDWFLDFLPKSNAEIDWNKELANSLSYQLKMLAETKYNKFISETVEEINAKIIGLSGLDAVRAANEYIKTCVSFEKKEVERLNGAIQQLVISEDVDMSVDPVELKSKLDKMGESIIQLRSDKATYESQEKLREELEKLSDAPTDLATYPEFAQTKIKVKELEDRIASDKITIESFRSTIQTLQASYNSYQTIINSCGVCPFTNADCPSIKAKIVEIESRQKETEKAIVVAKESLAQQEAIKTEREKEIGGLQLYMDSMKRQCERKNMILTQIKNVPPVSDDYLALAQDEYNKAFDEYTALTANLKAKKLIDQFTEQKYDAELKLEMYKTWDKHTGVNGLQCDPRLGNPFEKFATIMDKYIPNLFMDSNTKASFYSDGKANSFSFGIVRDNRYIKYDDLSSGEKCLFTLSMLMCIVSVSDAPLKLLVVDDLLDHLDSDRINNLFEVLTTQKDIQVICAGVKEVSSQFDDFITEIK